jgi:ATP-dependent DNA ligase
LPISCNIEGDWLYEIKFDGYRALAFKEGRDVKLVSRNEKAFDYPQLLDAFEEVASRTLYPRRRNCRAQCPE